MTAVCVVVAGEIPSVTGPAGNDCGACVRLWCGALCQPPIPYPVSIGIDRAPGRISTHLFGVPGSASTRASARRRWVERRRRSGWAGTGED
jgi:hypothetical protein